MSDEIKEKIKAYYVANDINEILYYITNLQEENEKLKKQLEYLRSGEYLNQIKWERDFLQSIVDEKDIDYKSRNEKAIEYIKKHLQMYDIDDSVGNFDEFEILAKPSVLLNILNGGDKE